MVKYDSWGKRIYQPDDCDVWSVSSPYHPLYRLPAEIRGPNEGDRYGALWWRAAWCFGWYPRLNAVNGQVVCSPHGPDYLPGPGPLQSVFAIHCRSVHDALVEYLYQVCQAIYELYDTAEEIVMAKPPENFRIETVQEWEDLPPKVVAHCGTVVVEGFEGGNPPPVYRYAIGLKAFLAWRDSCLPPDNTQVEHPKPLDPLAYYREQGNTSDPAARSKRQITISED